jgi:hypothetical protein
MMIESITLNGEKFPLALTGEGENLISFLGVNMKAVEFGIKSEKLKYLYCMVAGAARVEKKDFPFTLEQFIKALPGDWEQIFKQFKVQSSALKVEKTPSVQTTNGLDSSPSDEVDKGSKKVTKKQVKNKK